MYVIHEDTITSQDCVSFFITKSVISSAFKVSSLKDFQIFASDQKSFLTGKIKHLSKLSKSLSFFWAK